VRIHADLGAPAIGPECDHACLPRIYRLGKFIRSSGTSREPTTALATLPVIAIWLSPKSGGTRLFDRVDAVFGRGSNNNQCVAGVPPMPTNTGTRPATISTVAATLASISASSRVGASPVLSSGNRPATRNAGRQSRSTPRQRYGGRHRHGRQEEHGLIDLHSPLRHGRHHQV
jgi:hypothetical protein